MTRKEKLITIYFILFFLPFMVSYDNSPTGIMAFVLFFSLINLFNAARLINKHFRP